MKEGKIQLARKTREANGFIFRPARLDETREIAMLEAEVWEENGASEAQVASRIEVFSAGNFVAERNNKIVAFGSLEIVDDVSGQSSLSWDKITDGGYIRNSHIENGDYIYGVNLSVHHSMNGFKLGNLMMLFSLVLAVEHDMAGVFAGARIPGFRNYRKHYSSASAEEYVALRRNGRSRDYEISVYEAEGFVQVKLLPEYFPDPDSLNYGLLVLWKNPYKGKGSAELAAKLWKEGRIKTKIEKGGL